MTFYFSQFESRTPPAPLEHSPVIEAIWQFLAVVCAALGLWYLWWRWTASLNTDALWFALPVVIAETGAYAGLLLWIINLWRVADTPMAPPPATFADCIETPSGEDARPLAVDIMFATYSEDPELVRLGLKDAKAVRAPAGASVKIHVLDDGRRPAMAAVAKEEGVNYIARPTNEGFKAGNLRHALERTSGDFIVICDADTRPFPTLLERTLGYFRDPKVAWVQTPQWFYDIPEGVPLDEAMGKRFGAVGRRVGKAVQSVFGPLRIGEDPYINDPKMFYDVILRRRNWANASFCCGAGSIHRREAVVEASLRVFGAEVERKTIEAASEVTIATRERDVADAVVEAIRDEVLIAEVLTPYKFHVSEDIYTSIVLHSDRERGWRSVLHPMVESKMLSPQDLLSWTVQRFKYAGGSLDILLHDNPLFRSGLTLPQRLMYAATFWSYLGALWNAVFLTAPIVYLFTGIAPVSAYTSEFFLHILPFLVTLELATLAGTWGLSGYKSKAAYLAFFSTNLRALWTVVRGKKISFPVTPKDRQAGRHIRLVWPQLAVIGLTVAGALIGTTMYLSGNPHFSLGGLLTNLLWGVNNCLAMWVLVSAALWQPSDGAAHEGS